VVALQDVVQERRLSGTVEQQIRAAKGKYDKFRSMRRFEGSRS
jgi:hypothetical protein